MQPDIDELRNIRNSYFKNNEYERNRRENSERLRNRHNYENYNYNFNSNRNSYNRKRNNRGLIEKIKIIIKTIFKKDESVVYTIIAINIIVYMAWEYATYKQEMFFDTDLLDFMHNYFTISWTNLVKRKRYCTLLTSMFSHEDIIHLLSNMVSFYSFSLPVVRCIGKKKFVTSYLLSGIGSSIAHVSFYHWIVPELNKDINRSIFYNFLFSRYIKNTYDNISSLGASGAITGVNTIFSCLYPTKLITYNNFLRLPAWLTMTLFIFGDFYRSLTLTNGHIDTIGHVGGGK
ncbi:hypothetical protein BCR32DRAFT_201174 [Anaeromyces robustus]|uniref:Peptidase S54 rhomboid domain-containing protein n=1 Tax=Anaeromyces robustus TaxID=1754192 RepID=A0A1Y1XFI4_9FUNG|nr:hypothetical protein BCR32DRAFT_201174 [Anaeromyces robustus]|eukprot:ORX84144.1 hypothetical protein BCR32DRAFT_201174 [Anaeromyces robustus]